MVKNDNTSKNNIFVSNCIDAFAPYCGGVREGETLNEMGLQLTLVGIKNLLPSINSLLKLIDVVPAPHEIYSEDTNKTETSEALKELFTRHGSDKSVSHDYHLVYGEIFKKINRKSQLNILEIGLGSQNPSTPSRMCDIFKVGSSIRAYKEFFPNSQIFGADVDRGTLFTEERIQTSYVDQLNPATFDEMHKSFDSPSYDIFIEDGLHSFVSSLNSLNFALQTVKKDGTIILEDLTDVEHSWGMITSLLKACGYNARLISSGGLMLVISL
jgi:hypothetical protein